MLPLPQLQPPNPPPAPLRSTRCPLLCCCPGLEALSSAPVCLQRRMAEVLESREAHYLVIGLVLLDLAIVLAELVLSSFYPSPELAPHLGRWVARRMGGWVGAGRGRLLVCLV